MIVGSGEYRYTVVEGWGRGPEGHTFGGVVPAVAGDSKDRVYVVRRAPPAVLVYDRVGRFLTSWGENLFVNPHGIYITKEDHVWVTDVEDHTVRKLTVDGALLQTLGTPGLPGAPDTPFNMPARAVTAPSGDIFVADGYGQERVHRFSPDGELLRSWGSKGVNRGQFDTVHTVWVDRLERVWIADRANRRIQIFDVDGTYLDEWTDIAGPNEIYIDQDDVVYIAEGQRRVSIFSMDGELLTQWGEHGSAPGQFPDHPHGLWVDSHGDLYVAEVPFLDNRLQKYERI